MQVEAGGGGWRWTDSPGAARGQLSGSALLSLPVLGSPVADARGAGNRQLSAVMPLSYGCRAFQAVGSILWRRMMKRLRLDCSEVGLALRCGCLVLCDCELEGERLLMQRRLFNWRADTPQRHVGSSAYPRETESYKNEVKTNKTEFLLSVEPLRGGRSVEVAPWRSLCGDRSVEIARCSSPFRWTMMKRRRRRPPLIIHSAPKQSQRGHLETKKRWRPLHLSTAAHAAHPPPAGGMERRERREHRGGSDGAQPSAAGNDAKETLKVTDRRESPSIIFIAVSHHPAGGAPLNVTAKPAPRPRDKHAERRLAANVLFDFYCMLAINSPGHPPISAITTPGRQEAVGPGQRRENTLRRTAGGLM
ncbi:hypothetical protein EYF80_055851 [Liparis tanakae]|uniref:Uncharacterized protein n=1 Tax=Liparis tanakae TaxID=230148 RepID=A0A4Z2EYM3_9TELE|nr:hypothetical protein EYF80_055851 [Liparis tanakae]